MPAEGPGVASVEAISASGAVYVPEDGSGKADGAVARIVSPEAGAGDSAPSTPPLPPSLFILLTRMSRPWMISSLISILVAFVFNSLSPIVPIVTSSLCIIIGATAVVMDRSRANSAVDAIQWRVDRLLRSFALGLVGSTSLALYLATFPDSGTWLLFFVVGYSCHCAGAVLLVIEVYHTDRKVRRAAAAASTADDVQLAAPTPLDSSDDSSADLEQGRTGRSVAGRPAEGVEEPKQEEPAADASTSRLRLILPVVGALLGITALLVVYFVVHLGNIRSDGRLDSTSIGT